MPRSQIVELHRVESAERSDLYRLVDAYLAELSAHRERPVGPRDSASYVYLPLYWEEPGRHPFFVVVGRKRAGFVLVREIEQEGVIEMSDFYVCPKSRRLGLGRAALAEVWRRFPGTWRLQVHRLNTGGSKFWPRLIEEFASGRVEAREVIEEDGRRIQYSFEIAAA